MRRLISLLASIIFLAGCSSKPPEPLSLDQVPVAMQEAFADARQFVKKTAFTISDQVKSNQFAAASIQLQALLSNSELNKKQRDTATRAMMAVNIKLSEQAAVLEQVETPAPSQPPPSRAAVEQAVEAATAQQQYIQTK